MSDIQREHIQEAVTVSGLDGFNGEYRELGGGGVNDTFLLHYANGKAVLRVTRYDDVINLHKEADALRALTINNIPKLLYYDPESRIMGRAWILESYVEGSTPDRLTNQQYEKLGALLAEVHKLKRERNEPANLWANFIESAKFFGDEEHFMNHPDPEMQAIILRAKPYLIEQAKKFGNVEESLIHGDATPSNILVNGDDVALIDWEFASFKDPMSDFPTTFYDDMEANRGKWRVQATTEQKEALYDGYTQNGGDIDEERIIMWMNIDKLGLAVYLSWLVNESGRTYPEDQTAQYHLDLNNLKESLNKNLPLFADS